MVRIRREEERADEWERTGVEEGERGVGWQRVSLRALTFDLETLGNGGIWGIILFFSPPDFVVWGFFSAFCARFLLGRLV